MKRKILPFVIASLTVVFLLSDFGLAEEAVPPVPPNVKKMVGEAKASLKSIDMETLKAAIDNKEGIPIIDVRVPKEYAEGHVPGSINIPRGLVEFFVWGKVVGYPEETDTSKKIYVYCNRGFRAVLATKSLQDLGLTNVHFVDMQLAKWIEAGYPIEKQ